MMRRRDFLRRVGAAGAAAIALGPERASAEAPPEPTRIRMSVLPSICLSPQYVAESLLHAEGFTDVQYARHPDVTTGGVPGAMQLAAGEVDFDANFAAPLV